MDTLDKWVPLEDFDFNDPTLKGIHVDTRDFHVIGASENDLELKGETISTEKLAETLHRFKAESGGDKKWRNFAVRGYNSLRGWFKYIRCQKQENGEWLVYESSSDYERAVHPSDLEGEGYNMSWEQVAISGQGNTIASPDSLNEESYVIYDYKAPAYYKEMMKEFPKAHQYRRYAPKVQKNDPCSCGSGK